MIQKRYTTLILFFGFMFVSYGNTAVWAVPLPCATSTYDVYTTVVNAAGGCTIDDKLFKNFSFFSQLTEPVVDIVVVQQPVGVAVVPVSSPEFGFKFDFSSLTAVLPGETNRVVLGYNISTLSGQALISDASLSVVGSASGAGTAQVTDSLCLGGLNLPADHGFICGGTLVTLQFFQDSSTTSPLAHLVFGTPVSSVDVRKDLVASVPGIICENDCDQPLPVSSASILSVKNTVSQIAAVPEPASMLLMGIGLLAVPLLRGRQRTAS